MANDQNQCNFTGRLGQDPDMRAMPSGKSVANFTIAVGRSWKDRDGQKKEETEWVRIVTFDKLADIVGQYLKKGAQVRITGRMKTRKWQDKSGNDRYTTEIIADDMQMFGSRSTSDSSRPQSAPSGPATDDEFSDDIPFS